MSGAVFPSVAWFQRLADDMAAQPERYRKLGSVDLTLIPRITFPDGHTELFSLEFEGHRCRVVGSPASPADVRGRHPVIVEGDRDELTQVFENLIENACKYGQDGKLVDVSMTREEDGTVEASVTDYGPGIPDEHVPRITERFYRVNVESSLSKNGTGLGLAIVKHILTRHRARLTIRSEVGKGSTFTVRF